MTDPLTLPNQPSPSPQAKTQAAAASRALLFGNLVIGIGVMVVPGMLEQLALDLKISVPVSGQLISLAGLVMALGAPFAAASTSNIDRRLLLSIGLLFYLAGALLCVFAPGFGSLLLTRALMVLGAAIFTPQAAATIGLLVPAEKRPAAVATIFIGWSISAVVGMPLGSLIATYFGWRYGFLLVAVLALVGVVWVWRVIPNGLTVPKLSLDSWRQVAQSKRLLLILSVTLISSTGQFTVLTYVAPYLSNQVNATSFAFAALMAFNGLSGVAGSVWVTRNVGRLGVEKTVRRASTALALGLALWAIASLTAVAQWSGESGGSAWPSWLLLILGCAAWGAGSFATNATQQGRLAGVAPALASASIALNSSAMYAGQAAGALVGGVLIAQFGFSVLPWVGVIFLVLALLVSNLASRLSHPTP
jgi:predicted MFS family arabinose efflux permease